MGKDDLGGSFGIPFLLKDLPRVISDCPIYNYNHNASDLRKSYKFNVLKDYFGINVPYDFGVVFTKMSHKTSRSDTIPTEIKMPNGTSTYVSDYVDDDDPD